MRIEPFLVISTRVRVAFGRRPSEVRLCIHARETNARRASGELVRVWGQIRARASVYQQVRARGKRMILQRVSLLVSATIIILQNSY